MRYSVPRAHLRHRCGRVAVTLVHRGRGTSDGGSDLCLDTLSIGSIMSGQWEEEVCGPRGAP